MKRFIKNNCYKLTLLTLLTLPAIAASILMVPRVEASYSSSYLISDALFTDSKAMSSDAIQNFLEGKNSYLANYKVTENCGSTSGSHYAFYDNYYSCGSKVLASEAIYDVGRAYKISSKAILATLQKEQSLVTDPSPSSSQLNYAMGYGCPGECNPAFKGFFSQIDNGAWQFRVDIELMNGRNYWGYGPESYPCKNASSLYSTGLYPGRTVRFKNPGGKAKTIKLANSATAALYCYTPHVGPYNETGYSGSYNFVVSYEAWFGSTRANPIKATASDTTTGESGSTATIKFSLVTKPTANVTIPLSLSDNSEGSLRGTTKLVITPANWNKPSSNQVWIKGVNDKSRDGDTAYRLITGNPTSSDRSYGNLSYDDSPNVSLINNDNESDIPLSGDWDGDGDDTIGLKRGNVYYLDNNNNGTADVIFSYGNWSDRAIVGDWDGDGDDTIGLKRGNQYLLNNNNNGSSEVKFNYGKSSDIPLAGDWDGDGDDTVGVKRGNAYYLNYNSDGHHNVLFRYGSASDIPLAGDWDGDGDDTIGLKRGNQYLLNNNNNGSSEVKFNYGKSSDIPLAGDWDGDGDDTVGVKRGNAYYLNYNSDGHHNVLFRFGR